MPGSPGGRGAAEDPADVFTATVGEGVDATAELACHLWDEEHHSSVLGWAGTSWGLWSSQLGQVALGLSSSLMTISKVGDTWRYSPFSRSLSQHPTTLDREKSFPSI